MTLTSVVDYDALVFSVRDTRHMMTRQTIFSAVRGVLIAIIVSAGWTCYGIAADTVVVYSALDRVFSEPILKAYGQKSGVSVLSKFDVESTKTVGLTNLIIVEAARPRCDLFWNNEILNTLRLKERGLLAPFHPSHSRDLPETFRAKDATWYGFAARARILIVNTKLVAAGRSPQGDPGSPRPEVEGKDRHRQTSLRYHGDSCRLPFLGVGAMTGPRAAFASEGQRVYTSFPAISRSRWLPARARSRSA